jgi:hypothetical protein
MKAWYFAPPDNRLANGDGRKIALGTTHKVEGPPVLRKHGLHASVQLVDALRYSASGILYEVELSGEIFEGDDKCAATERTYIRGGIDLSDTFREFARWCALSVAHLWDMPAVVREYLETGDESKRTAARAAALDAEWEAARYAARAAAWAIARAAAWDAAWDAALDAALAAALDAALAAALDAALDAAWAAALEAARAAQNIKLVEMFEAAWAKGGTR